MVLWLALLLTALAAPGDPPGLQAVVERALAEQFPADAEQLRVRVLRTGGDVSAPPLRITLPAGSGLPRGHTQVDVLTSTPDGWQKTGWALLRIAHFDSVVVARRTVRRGEAVATADLGTAWLETTAFHGEPLRAADLRTFDGDLFAGRTLREGRALRRGDLRPAYAADTGDTVTMHYRRGGVAFSVPCHARAPGAVGDAVRLFSPSTGTTYRARLTAPGEASWIATL
ncbi:MAG: flagellar basal body P-ring formation chaperone FlgA [Bacteroidota bacterium]